MRQLGNAGIPAEIGRVDFRFDPDQDYVVVDIETTGGWANGDRITEIGAVKIRNHEVVAEWHSLINPAALDPRQDLRLTGITNEMVRDAPFFAEIADSFMQFMGDGIFVAHNVNFDYGFISSNTSVSSGVSAFRSSAPARACADVIPATSPIGLASSPGPTISN